MKRVSTESALVAEVTSASIRVIGVGATIGIDRARDGGRWILVEGTHVRVLLELRLAVGHVGVELGRASQIRQPRRGPHAYERDYQYNLKEASGEVWQARRFVDGNGISYCRREVSELPEWSEKSRQHSACCLIAGDRSQKKDRAHAINRGPDDGTRKTVSAHSTRWIDRWR